MLSLVSLVVIFHVSIVHMLITKQGEEEKNTHLARWGLWKCPLSTPPPPPPPRLASRPRSALQLSEHTWHKKNFYEYQEKGKIKIMTSLLRNHQHSKTATITASLSAHLIASRACIPVSPHSRFLWNARRRSSRLLYLVWRHSVCSSYIAYFYHDTPIVTNYVTHTNI